MIYILIPSYNDSVNFPSLLKNISKTLIVEKYKVVIVDDGSTDETKTVIEKLSKKYPVSSLGYKTNMGPGYAFKTGFMFLIPKISTKDTVVTMEADNSSDFSILKDMIFKTKTSDVVLSSPFAIGGKFLGLDFKRRVLSEVANYLDILIFRIKNVRTYSSFYRAYNGAILKKAESKYKDRLITEPGFSAVVELLLKLAKTKAQFSEIPAVLDWRKRKGKSKMKISKTMYRHLAIYKNYFLGKYS